MTIPVLQVPRDFGFSEEHELMRQSVRRFLSERFERGRLRAHVDAQAAGKQTFDADLFAEVVALGWTALPGGLYQALMCEELGRALFPLPVTASAIAANALGVDEHDGVLAVALSEAHHAPDARFVADAITATATRDGDGFVLRGAFAQVVAGAEAATLLAPFVCDGALSWFAVPRASVEATADRGMDATRATASVRVDGSVPASAQVEGGAALYRRIYCRALTLYAAEAVGAAETALLMTRDYACERKQFGRPIGTFQAVSHPLVNSMIAIEHARSLTLAAATALDGDDDLALDTLARMANAAASEALWQTASRGVQLHGGFGFTWDCDMHFYLRRAIAERGFLGSPEDQRRALADTLLSETTDRSAAR